MKKRSLLMAASLVLALLVATTGTLAYLSDVDSDVNVMTLGNVQIEQLELQRAEGVAHNATAVEGSLVPFEQGQPLYPAYPVNNKSTDYTAEANDLFFWGPYVYTGTAANGLWNDEKLIGAMDKMVFVKNTGSSEAYFRTWLAFECPEGMEYSQGTEKEFMMNVNGGDTYKWSEETYVTIEGTRYLVVCATYQRALPAGATSHPSLLQVVMTHNATNEDMALLGDTYEILAYTQAVQVNNFEEIGPEKALNVAFGEDHPWVNGVDRPALVYTADDLADAVANGGSILMMADIDMGSATLTVNKETTIDLAGHTLSGTGTNGQGCLIMVNNAGTLNIEDTSADQSGKITYTNTSKIGWTIDVEGQLNLYSGTIELTGEDWSIGYCVDVRPNAWGSKYANATVFHMYGGKLVSSDGAIRVASSSADSYADISAAFIMDGGEIEAKWDGVFIQQSNAAYDTLTVELNGGKITSDLAPVRFYGPDAASVNSGAAKPMKLVLGGTELVPAEVDASRNYYPGYDGVIVYGGGMSLDNLNQYTTIVK